jgi:two-component system chemotaxis response regulator CheB
MKKIKVLIVDDQASVRKIIKNGLIVDPEIEVVAEASDPYEARDKLLLHSPDVMTLDIEMPRMNGLDFLKKLIPQYPIPVIMVSSLTLESAAVTFDALETGAFDYVTKPMGSPEALQTMLAELREKIKEASKIDIAQFLKNRPVFRKTNKVHKLIKQGETFSKIKLVAIGASTGGTIAIRELLLGLPRDMPGLVIVLHMPAGFTKSYAERLNEICELEVFEAAHGDEIVHGKAFLAPGDSHLTVVQNASGKMIIKLNQEEKVNGHRPAVDVMFNSISETSIASKSIGVILTGMGGDGSKGLLKLKNAGAKTIGQDEESSIVYGMPKVAMDIGAVQIQLPLMKISDRIKMIIGS